jgi:hypothetical protein
MQGTAVRNPSLFGDIAGLQGPEIASDFHLPVSILGLKDLFLHAFGSHGKLTGTA